MNKRGFTVGAVLVILGVALIVIGMWQGTPRSVAPEVQPVGGDRDVHGCIGSAGYSWCAAKQKCLRVWEEYCGPAGLDAAFGALTAIRAADAGIYGYATSSTFEWRTSGNATSSVDGLVIEAADAHAGDYALAKSYFKNNGFSESNPNAADSPIGSQTGYEKNGLVCLTERRMTDLTTLPNEPVKIDSDLQTIEIYCGNTSS